MADFDRSYAVPSGSTWPKFPTGLDSWGQSGKSQLRTTTQVGRTWEESYPPMKASAANTRAFIAYVNQLWNQRTIFTIKHFHLQDPLGTTTNTLYVWGASQTGNSINISRSNSSQLAIQGTLKAGDIITFANINLVYDIASDVADGSTTISISPPIITGGSPADKAVITYASGLVKFRATLASELVIPRASYTAYYEGMTLFFREVP